MELSAIYHHFPDHASCVRHLEASIWNNEPECPYCHSKKRTAMPKESRYHCNSCNKSYSVMVNTIFHKSKVDLQKWFYAFYLIMETDKDVSARKLAAEIDVNKDSAWYMLKRIKQAVEEGFSL